MKPRPGSLGAQHAKRATQKGRFLAAYAEHATIDGAAKACGMGRRTHYNWLASDEAYAAAFGDAEQAATDALEGEARRRALAGVEEPVFGSLGAHMGSGVVGHIRKYSDTLLIFLLKAKRPEQFRDRYELTGKDGGPIETKVTTIQRVIVEPAKEAA